MNIVVLGGSPKGQSSLTLKYVHFMEQYLSDVQFDIIPVAHGIKGLEQNEEKFDDVMNRIESADVVLWAFPVYVLTVPANYHRFIELIYERQMTKCFKGKYTALLTTSIHFYDNTALNYMQGICDDLGMRFVDSISFHMQDLNNAEKKHTLKLFADQLVHATKEGILTSKSHAPIDYTPTTYTADTNPLQALDTKGKKILIIADSLKNKNLAQMIAQFRNNYEESTKLIVLEDKDIKGSCLGCLKCAYDYNCIYGDKDDIRDIYVNHIGEADILIFAGEIKHRYLSSKWKTFWDRCFYNNHSPSFPHKHVGFLLSGPMTQLSNLQEIVEAYIQINDAHYVGFISDEYESRELISQQINAFAKRCIDHSLTEYQKPSTFLGVSGKKIFRDAIWGDLRFPFIADYKKYKELGYFDFPQQNRKSRLQNMIVMTMCKIPSIRKSIYDNMAHHVNNTVSLDSE